MHQFKNYATLNQDFKDKITTTYIGKLSKEEILDKIKHSKDLFFDLIQFITKEKEYLKYKDILDKYIIELLN